MSPSFFLAPHFNLNPHGNPKVLATDKGVKSWQIPYGQHVWVAS